MDSRHILITGATGTIGREIVGELLATGEPHLYLLLREKGRESERQRADRLLDGLGPAHHLRSHVHIVSGDVTEPLCGVSAMDQEILQERIDTFFHVAAITYLNGSKKACEQINVGGTAEALRLAWQIHHAGRLKRFVYFSTAFTPGSRRKYHSLEDELPDTPAHANFYEWSKYHAEQSVRDAMKRGLPSIILRPSIVVGHSETGAVADFKVIYPMLRLLMWGSLKTFPTRLENTLKIVPIDFVVRAALAIAFAGRDDVTGHAFHLVSKELPTIGMLWDLVHTRYSGVPKVSVVPPDGFNPRFLSGTERQLFAAFEPLLGYLNQELTFDTRNADVALGGTGVAWPVTDAAFLQRLLDYAVNRGYFGESVRPVAIDPPPADRHHREHLCAE
jgi:nucleoside-diphosphate-sugar epimerase